MLVWFCYVPNVPARTVKPGNTLFGPSFCSYEENDLIKGLNIKQIHTKLTKSLSKGVDAVLRYRKLHIKIVPIVCMCGQVLIAVWGPIVVKHKVF